MTTAEANTIAACVILIERGQVTAALEILRNMTDTEPRPEVDNRPVYDWDC